MAREAQRFEQEFIATAKEKTGYDLAEWMEIVAQSGETKTNSLIAWLKSNYHLNHSQATFITVISQNDGKPTQDYPVLLEKLFTKLEHQKDLYAAIIQLIEDTFSPEEDVVCIPTKAYVSLEAKRVFACVKINKDNIRLGLDLGELPFDNYLVAAKSLGAMPNIKHMIELKSIEDVNEKVAKYLRQSHDLVHKIE